MYLYMFSTLCCGAVHFERIENMGAFCVQKFLDEFLSPLLGREHVPEMLSIPYLQVNVQIYLPVLSLMLKCT